MSFLGFEIGGTKLQLVLGEATGEISERWRFDVEPAKGGVGIRQQIEAALPGLLKKGPVKAVGLGFGGPVNWQTGRICLSHQIEGWSEFDLRGWLEPLVKAPVVVDNDANVAALGEALNGTGRGFEPVFYVTLGSGVGGGLVTGGRIYHGARPGEAEIGHIRLDRTGTSLESRCSGWAVDARIRAVGKQFPDGVLAKKLGAKEGGEARHLSAALEANDSAARAILDELAADLSFGLSHVVHLFHPQVIVLGGGLSHIGEPLRSAVAEALKHFLMEAFLPGPKIALASLGEDSVPVGALLLATK
ncbi:MAG TPA: ROK family protein, partial [Candidatus Dormibacteraeota bacterium]|nr:ROK family protein [Candidatus Dormibacteraeota bacterium]